VGTAGYLVGRMVELMVRLMVETLVLLRVVKMALQWGKIVADKKVGKLVKYLVEKLEI